MERGSPTGLLWEYAFLHAGAKHGIDPNLLVGLATRESSLRRYGRNGEASGIFQITPKRQTDLGLSDRDLYNPNVVVDSVAATLANATKGFQGNSDLALASWTAGLAGAEDAYKRHGMDGVRNLALSRAHPSYGRVGDYIDFIKGFQQKRLGTGANEADGLFWRFW